LTIRDVVRVHSELVKHLGIQRLLAVAGGSLGGMQVLEWSVLFPEQLQAAIVLASAPRLSAQGIAFNAGTSGDLCRFRVFQWPVL